MTETVIEVIEAIEVPPLHPQAGAYAALSAHLTVRPELPLCQTGIHFGDPNGIEVFPIGGAATLVLWADSLGVDTVTVVYDDGTTAAVRITGTLGDIEAGEHPVTVSGTVRDLAGVVGLPDLDNPLHAVEISVAALRCFAETGRLAPETADTSATPAAPVEAVAS